MTKIVDVVYIVEKFFCYLFHDGFTVLTADDAEMQYWTCGYRGLCRRFCYAQEYIVGHHGCPRRYRYMNDLFEMYTCNVLYHVYCLRDLGGVWSALSDIHNNSSMLDFCCSDVTRFCAISWSFCQLRSIWEDFLHKPSLCFCLLFAGAVLCGFSSDWQSHTCSRTSQAEDWSAFLTWLGLKGVHCSCIEIDDHGGTYGTNLGDSFG